MKEALLSLLQVVTLAVPNSAFAGGNSGCSCGAPREMSRSVNPRFYRSPAKLLGIMNGVREDWKMYASARAERASSCTQDETVDWTRILKSGKTIGNTRCSPHMVEKTNPPPLRVDPGRGSAARWLKAALANLAVKI